MTGTDIREALHAVADATQVPAPDRVAFQRQVRRERRTRLAGRAAVARAAAVVLCVAATSTVLLRGGGGPVAGSPPEVVEVAPGPLGVDLETPFYFVSDHRLVALTPRGHVLDVGLRAEAVVGWSDDFVIGLSTDGALVRFDVSTTGAGSGGWRFHRVDGDLPDDLQAVALSSDGRWLAWVDLADRLWVDDLEAEGVAEPAELRTNSALTDVASGTGATLVSENGDLVLLTDGNRVAVPTAEDGYGLAATASGELVAVPDRDGVTRVYDVSSGTAELLDEVPGIGLLSTHGTHLVSVAHDGGDGSGSVLLWTPSGEARNLDTPGVPQEAVWADRDTFVLTSLVDGRIRLLGCDVLDRVRCRTVPHPEGGDISLTR
jgi:hypothetical protein